MKPDQIDREHKQSKSRPDGLNPDGSGRDDRDVELERRARMAPAAGSWQDIKSRFVDDPAGAIAAAEQLVQRAVDSKVRALKDEAAALCQRERSDREASTEDLRAQLLRCQDYCERLTGRSQ